MEDWKYKKARKRVKAIKGFYHHFTAWLIFSIFFVFMNIQSGDNEFWAIFPIMSWGIGLLFHAISVFGLPGLGGNWEERLMRRELERIERESEVLEWHECDEEMKEIDSPSSQDFPAEKEELELKPLSENYKDSDFV